jgi:AcrR family transcriptional regulator
MAGYARTAVRRQQIAEAALEVIAERGLGAFTTKAIAAQVGLTDGALFRHFPNKTAIVLGALEVLEGLMFAEHGPEPADPLERLEGFFRRRAALIGGGPAVGRLLFSEQLVHAAGEAGREKICAWRDRNMRLVGGCLQPLAEQGRLRDGLSPSALLPVVQGLLLGAFLERSLRTNEVADLASRIDSAWHTLTILILKEPG